MEIIRTHKMQDIVSIVNVAARKLRVVEDSKVKNWSCPLFYKYCPGAAVAEWLSSWLAEQEDRGSIPGLATWIFRVWFFPASKSQYGWNTAEAT